MLLDVFFGLFPKWLTLRPRRVLATGKISSMHGHILNVRTPAVDEFSSVHAIAATTKHKGMLPPTKCCVLTLPTTDKLLGS